MGPDKTSRAYGEGVGDDGDGRETREFGEVRARSKKSSGFGAIFSG